MSEYSRQYYANNRERLRAYYNEYSKANPEKIRASQKAAAAKRRDKVNAKDREHRKTSAGKLKTCWANLVARCTYPKHIAYKYYGGRGIQNLLTFEELKTLWERDSAAQMTKPSIDRMDNAGHYIFENCRFIEQSENSRRAHLCKFQSPFKHVHSIWS